MMWLHRLLNPHCEHCREQEREAKHCNNCDMWKQEVARLQIENDRLLERILNPPTKDETSKSTDINEFKPIVPRSIPWNERRKLLEQEDKNRAQLLKQNSASDMDKLEEEIINAPRSN